MSPPFLLTRVSYFGDRSLRLSQRARVTRCLAINDTAVSRPRINGWLQLGYILGSVPAGGGAPLERLWKGTASAVPWTADSPVQFRRTSWTRSATFCTQLYQLHLIITLQARFLAISPGFGATMSLPRQRFKR